MLSAGWARCAIVKWQVVFAAAFALLAVWLVSISAFVRHYGTFAAWSVGNGVAGVYWRGDPELRKAWLFNGGEWPLRKDSQFAGTERPQGDWEVYGPSLALWELRAAMKGGASWAEVSRSFGFGWPDVRITNDAACVVIPLGPVAAGAFVLACCVLKRGRRVRLGTCRSCGYDLRITPDRCPECGTPIPGKVVK